MKTLLVCILIILPAVFVFCQETNDRLPAILKINLPSLGDQATFPTLRLSAEKKISIKTSVAVEIGYQWYTIEHFVDTVHTKPRGIKLGAEFRYYPGHKVKTDMTGFYTAAAIVLHRSKYSEDLAYYPKDDPEIYPVDMIIDNFVVNKTITGLNLLVGRQSNFRVPTHKEKRKKVFPRIFLDGSVGMGVVYRNVKNGHREFDEDIYKRYTSRHPNFFDALVKSGLSENSGLKPSFVFNFRVGYRL